MMSEAPGPINFTMFLTMFGEKLNGTDPEDVIRNAFACFDEEATGTVNADQFSIATGKTKLSSSKKQKTNILLFHEKLSGLFLGF